MVLFVLYTTNVVNSNCFSRVSSCSSVCVTHFMEYAGTTAVGNIWTIYRLILVRSVYYIYAQSGMLYTSGVLISIIKVPLRNEADLKPRSGASWKNGKAVFFTASWALFVSWVVVFFCSDLPLLFLGSICFWNFSCDHGTITWFWRWVTVTKATTIKEPCCTWL